MKTDFILKRRTKYLSSILITSAFTLVHTNTIATTAFIPTASEVFVQKIEGKKRLGNALISATYDYEQWEKNKKKIPSIINLTTGKESVSLRDDGRAGDEKSGDGVYSAIIEYDFNKLIEKYQRVEEAKKKFGEKGIPSHFEGRQLMGSLKLIGVEKLVEKINKGETIKLENIGISADIDWEKSLLIRDPLVVQDPKRTYNACTGKGNPDGAWTFKHLVTNIANSSHTGISPENLVRKWLAHWESTQIVNGWTVDARSTIQELIIDPWEEASGGSGEPLNLDKAPFQLLAIVNRVDLRRNLLNDGDDQEQTYGGSAGEGRFVFQTLDMRKGKDCSPMKFLSIFEYGIPLQKCEAIVDWGKQWNDLSNPSLTLGSPAYNASLQAITDFFVTKNAAPKKPNRSALNQLRTNETVLSKNWNEEISFKDEKWQLREFIIPRQGGFLKQDTVKLTPDNSYNNTFAIDNFISNGIPPYSLGGASDYGIGFFWNGVDINPNSSADVENRHQFSLKTCNGCHAGETNTEFTHIKSGPIPAVLSKFMTGIVAIDPINSAVTHHFNDLKRRTQDLDILVNTDCNSKGFADMLLQKPIKSPH